MTRQEWKERLPIIQAFAEGKRVQEENVAEGWVDLEDPEFHRPIHFYRIAPEPTYRPWRPEEVPVGAVVRHEKSGERALITAAGADGVRVGAAFIYYVDILPYYTMADGSPCGVKEEAL